MKKNFILCGLAGWCMEVLWTGTSSIMSRDPKLTCRTSMWMFPIYGMASLFAPMSRHLAGKNFWIRGSIYTLCIFTTEFIIGSFLKKGHMCPWDYSGHRGSVCGVIDLSYAPVWFGVGLFFEAVLKDDKKIA